MTKSEIANCKTPLELKWLWEAQPENKNKPLAYMEKWRSKIIKHREQKQ